MYIALARSIDSFNSSLCQSLSLSLIHPVVDAVEEARVVTGSAEDWIKFGDPGNVDFVGDMYAGGFEGENSPLEPPGMV